MGILDGRVAICTGSGRGVGAEVAKLMAKEGAKVIVNDPGVGGGGEGGGGEGEGGGGEGGGAAHARNARAHTHERTAALQDALSCRRTRPPSSRLITRI